MSGDSGEGDANAVYINNSSVAGDPDRVPGGLIVGVTGSGIDISGVEGESGVGGVTVDNRGSQYTTFVLGSLDPAVYTEGGTPTGLLAAFGGESGLVVGGIYGEGDGVHAEFVGGDFAVLNEDGLIRGASGSGVRLEEIGGLVTISNGVTQEGGPGGVIGGGLNGVFIDTAGAVTINNGLGSIYGEGDGGRGVALYNISGAIDIENAGGSIAGLGNSSSGVEVQHAASGVKIVNGDPAATPGDVDSYGWISGSNGVYLNDISAGLIDIDSSFGGIIGRTSGILVEGSEADIEIQNTAGLIEGYIQSGIGITGLGGNTVSITNGSTYGGTILGGKIGSAIEVSQVFGVAITNESSWLSEDGAVLGGLILGAGTADHPVIGLGTDWHQGGGATIDNHGIIAAIGEDGYLYTDDNVTESDLYAPHIPGLTLPSTPDQTPGDLAQIYTDAGSYIAFASSGGALGSLTGLENYAQAAADLAVAAGGGAVRITNQGIDSETGFGGLVFGRVYLSGFNQVSEGEGLGNLFTNYGAWFTVGTSTLDGSGADRINNAGLIQAALDSSSNESTTFDVSVFYNGYDDLPGILSVMDGAVGDSATITGNLVGVPSTSLIAIDAYLDVPEGDGAADVLYVQGSTSGSTGVIINALSGSPGGRNQIGIPFAYVADGDEEGCIGGSGDLCSDGDTFYVSDRSQGYITVNGIGAIQHGLYAWAIKAADKEGPREYDLVSDWAPETEQAGQMMEAGTYMFYGAGDLVSEHVYGGHFSDDGGAGADPAPDGSISGQPVGRSSALWARVTGTWADRQTAIDSTTFGQVDAHFMQSTYTLLGGTDMSPSGDGDGVRLGVYGGYTTSSGHFAGYSASAGFKGGVAGAYAAYTTGGAYVDAQFDAQFVKVSLDDSSAALNASSNGTTLGVIVNAGKRFDVGFGYFEPIASFTYANTTLSDMVSGPATLSFDNTQSIRAAVGARVGAVISSSGGGSTEISVLGKLWNEFAGNTAVTVSDSVDSDTFRDSSAGLSGEVAASITTYNAAKTLSGFVSAGAEMSSDSTTVNAKVGVRKSF